MNKAILFAGIAGMAIAAVGCGDSGAYNSNANAANRAGNTVAAPTNAVAAPTKAAVLSPSEFVTEAAQGGMAEVEMGKLAGQKSQNAEIKKFGQMMVTDHGKANEELKELAGKKGFTMPSDIGSHKMAMTSLEQAENFDKVYVDMMLTDHNKDVEAFEKQAASGTDPDVKAFAAKTLPTLKKHLEAIKAIRDKTLGDKK